MNNENLDPENNSEKQFEIEPTMSPTKAAVLGLIAVFLIFQFGGALLTLSIFGFDINNADVNLMRLLTIGSQVLFILFPAILFAKLVFEDVTTVLKVKMPHPKEVGLFVLGLIILIPLLQNYLVVQNYLIDAWAESNSIVNQVKGFFDSLDELVEDSYLQLLTANNFIEMILVIITVSVTPAICEEFFFRGFVQNSFRFKLSPFVSIFLTSLFFGFYHFNPYGLLPLIAIGMYLGFAVFMSNSIVVPVILHFLNNFVSIIFFFIYGEEELIQSSVVDVETFNTQLFTFVILLVVFIGFLIFIKRNYSKIINYEVQDDLS